MNDEETVILLDERLSHSNEIVLDTLQLRIKEEKPVVFWQVSWLGAFGHADGSGGDLVIPQKMLSSLTAERLMEWVSDYFKDDSLANFSSFAKDERVIAWCEMVRKKNDSSISLSEKKEVPLSLKEEKSNMLTDSFIQEEAKRRLEAMPKDERKAKEAEIRKGLQVSAKVSREGYKSLTKEEVGIYHRYNSQVINSSGGGDINMKAIEFDIQKRLNASREDIASMKKNPYLSKALRAFLIMAVICIGGVLLTALIEKASGWNMGYVYVGFSTLSGILAMGVAGQLITAYRFRKLRKAYEDPKFQESEIKAAVFRLLHQSVKDQFEKEQ